MKTKLFTLFLLFALLLVPTGNAYAQSPGGDVVLVGDNYTVKSGETLNGSLVVIGGNVSVEEDAKVTGDVVVIGGNISLDGNASQNVVVIGGNAASSAKVSGDMVAIGGQISLKKTAIVAGNVVMLGGQLSREEGSEVGGEIVNNAPPIKPPAVPNVPAVPGVPSVPSVPNVPSLVDAVVYENPFWNVMGVFGRALGVGLIAMVLSLFLQPQMERISDTIIKQPFLAGSFGLMAMVLAPLAIIIMTVTIILIPVAVIVAFILPLAWLFGMIALGQELGERFTKAVNQIWAPVLTNGFGAFLLVLVVGLFGLVPCVGWLAGFLVTLVALGGVAMTWFGTRSSGTLLKPATVPVVEVVEVPPAS